MAILQTALTQMGHYGDHMDWNDGPSWWMVTIMIISGALVIGVIVWAIVYTTRHVAGGGRTPPVPPSAPGSNARAILDERFARGEIDAAEYEERRRLLG